ncbi:FAD/NAD(P)-binding domain-containing protein [Mytilinidion resinicola]|uniref:FAD/NAD(P)-binding domain-containing protein n=1 Tax=Mytilinidion resinicola TaxID=574789 RepID=A0A6A6Z4X5_9PEZI|nr:FAD/NAD(P)-binding domain-containing protein [Mytilinidion resinicola]KAF2816126.1 FAD/NAD(P)-binding domain-containing protein [Mytilinidion resinicola]
MPPLTIAIIGAGPGGLLLARLLLRSPPPISVSIFEAEASATTRSQGSTLDLRPGGGLKAMREAGLWDEFCAHARWSGEALKVVDKKLVTWLSRSGGSQTEPREWGAAPEIDRRVLRDVLLGSVGEGVVRWEKKVASVEVDDGTGKGVVRFVDGGEEGGFDLVVGADGCWSKVRAAVSEVKPVYSGVGGFSFSISDCERRAPEVWKLVDGGSVFGYSDSKGLNGQVLGDGSVSVSAWGVRGEDWMRERGYDVYDLEQAREGTKKEYVGWAKELTNMLDAVDDDVVPRSLYMLPVDFAWEHKRGVTLLGDAAHVMTPFAGIGVNMALQDAMELAHAIIDAAKETGKSVGKDVLDEQMRKYEKELFPRMHAAQEITDGAMKDMYFTEGAPRTSIHRWCSTVAGHDMHPLVRPVFTAALYTYFFIFRMFV